MPEIPPHPSVSVALCTHNGERFLAEQLASILGQSQPVTELVLSDDASSDGTVELVRSAVAAAVDEGAALALTVLQNDPALGVVRNFEQALAACTGEVIVLCDQDDVWRDDRVARVLEEFAADASVLLVHGDAELIDGGGAPLGRGLADTQRISEAERAELTGGRSLDTLLRRNLVTGATVAFRRELLESALPFTDSWLHDEWLAILAAATGRTAYIRERLVGYRQHGGNQVGVVQRGFSARFARLLEPREARNARLVARARALHERLDALAVSGRVSGEVLAASAQKLAHDRRRQSLPRLRILRPFPVLFEAMTGRYSRFGRGRQDVARDLMQPAR